MLSYVYSTRYNNFIDFALQDDLDMFDFENVNVLYLDN